MKIESYRYGGVEFVELLHCADPVPGLAFRPLHYGRSKQQNNQNFSLPIDAWSKENENFYTIDWPVQRLAVLFSVQPLVLDTILPPVLFI